MAAARAKPVDTNTYSLQSSANLGGLPTIRATAARAVDRVLERGLVDSLPGTAGEWEKMGWLYGIEELAASGHTAKKAKASGSAVDLLLASYWL
jgi:hypothetical protein